MKSALVMFAKTPLPGLVKTRLTPPLSAEEGADLYRCMLLDTIARSSSLPVDAYIAYEGDQLFFREQAPGVSLFPQQGENLGTRLEMAFEKLTALGYRARVVIGTDAPDLPLSFLEEAFRLLEAGREVVFGPAEDGGYYLVGLSCASGTLFREIPWSGPEVLARSLERAAEDGRSVALLPSWYDVDSFQDLQRPGLRDPHNGAALTRAFLDARGIGAP